MQQQEPAAEPVRTVAQGLLPGLVQMEAKSGDLVVCLGAGDITTWAYALPGQLEALGWKASA